jgi:hypothetical protein
MTKNKEMQDQLKGVKNQNEELTSRKSELSTELKKAKEDL